ncbi:MAG: phosphatase PAP2 family protein [Rhodocyclaceae bacterium]
MNFPPALPWYRQAAARALVLMPLKAFGTMAFMVLFFSAYFAVLRHPLLPPTVMPLILADTWVPFSPAAFPVYASLWVYVSLPPALFSSFRPLALYGLWIAGLCLFCLALFWVFPTTVPVFVIDWEAHPELAVLRGLDLAGNACPSLHVATAVFSAFWLDRIFQRLDTPLFWRGLSALHCLLILWSTVAIRQHVVLDVLAGMVVGGIFAGLSYAHIRRAVGDQGL